MPRPIGVLFAARMEFFRSLIVVAAVAGAAAVSGVLAPRDRAIASERWFMPGAIGREAGRVLPPGATPPVPPVAARAFLTRIQSDLAGEAEETWIRRNGGTEPLPFMHHLMAVFPRELHARHPEFFPLVGGQRLQPPPRSRDYWNPDLARPDVAEFAAAAARAHFERQPDAVGFSLGTNDGLVWGESPELLALTAPRRWFRGRPDYSNLVFTFMNRAATALARTHPDRYLGALAYYWCEQVPDFPLHRQVVPFLTSDRSQGYDPVFAAEDAALTARWAALAGAGAGGEGKPPRRLGLYDYLDGHGFLVPRIYHRRFAAALREARRLGFTDHFAEIPANRGLDGFTPWMVAQLTQDPEQDVEALRREFLDRYFGAAAEPMRRFYDRAEELWSAQPGPGYWMKYYRNVAQAAVVPPAAARALRADLEAAAAAAATALTRARVRKVADAFGVTERFLAFQSRRDALMRLMLVPEPDRGRIAAEVPIYREARRDFIRYTDALRRREPRAFYPFEWLYYLMNDPAVQAEALLRPPAGPERDLLVDPGWIGTPGEPRRSAGLDYGVAVPPGWSSTVEPAELHRPEWSGPAEARRLCIEGARDTTVSQWAATAGSGRNFAEVWVRGRVGPGTAVTLAVAWLDAKQRHLGVRTVRLPEGDWPDWVRLVVACAVPREAVQAGTAVRVQNQVPGDRAEFRGLRLTAAP
jgi:hypothetical protein